MANVDGGGDGDGDGDGEEMANGMERVMVIGG